MKPDSEHTAGLAILPGITTGCFYLLPHRWQSNIFIQFIPQITAYIALAFWATTNHQVVAKLGLDLHKIPEGLKLGTCTGIVLGSFNTTIILAVIPALGGNISFLRDTPHGQLPFWVMIPWFILFIACVVELNFRGFLLGRLLTYSSDVATRLNLSGHLTPNSVWLIPLMLSALIFSFDPFMVMTFGLLHWIAVWDGLMWGWLWIRFQNLYLVITAHAIEVVILYISVRHVLA